VTRGGAWSAREAERHGTAGWLWIEVAGTWLPYGPATKLRLSASFGVPEYWVVDCAAEAVEVHREPGSSGYRDVRRVAGAGSVALQAFPDVVLPLLEIFA